MTKALYEQAQAKLPGMDIPAKYDLIAQSAKATLLGSGPVQCGGLCETRPALREGSMLYVWAKLGDEEQMLHIDLHDTEFGRHAPDKEALGQLYEQAEVENFDVRSIGSCVYYLAENSFGFSTTHPRYTEETWLQPIVDKVRAYHGEDAFKTLDTLIDIIGMAGHEGEFEGGYAATLMQVAQIQSEYHRKVREF